MRELEIKAYAKLNLTLDIGEIIETPSGKLHQINSVFQAIDLYDTLTITEGLRRVEVTGWADPMIEDNLVFKAWQAICGEVDLALPVNIHLNKTIYTAAGLGGGSSDAAATLIGLNQAFNFGIPIDRLMEVASRIGSDIPYFVAGEGTAMVSGTGEIIEPYQIEFSPFFLVARLHERWDTCDMYTRWDALETHELPGFLEVAINRSEAIRNLVSIFKSSSIQWGLSGSGPTMFAGFDSVHSAEEVRDLIAPNFNGDLSIQQPVDQTYELNWK